MGCSVQTDLVTAPRKRVAVNGLAIAHDVISREAQNHKAPTPLAAWTAAARALVVRALLLNEARRLGIAAGALSDAQGRRETEEEAMIRTLVEREVATPLADAEACLRYYESNRRRFRSADIYEAAHILFAARKDERLSFDRARAAADAALEILKSEPGRFAELARVHSACPSGSQGGNLGQLTAGQTTPEFEAALSALEPGAMTERPIETRYGFHIIKLERKIAGKELPFEFVQERIADYLADRVHRIAVAQYVSRLAAQSEIEGVALPTPADLRVA
ncbi:peptidylprolyl isomerase [Hyphomicrobium sp. LHD-15]|uniref:peptidylprolyl isomerase n=1 Tax=Hyphomicrobium sp. LHD-15 TaxID=3072142 RepID=UPI0028109C22|nr:peptidylprolyl isomerase [Hyphomicrobium sp. LHD-15]MDQ8698253.1 peptidylprolyl isomerase [Hyphomicrobium sp. LHD-15]